MQVRLWQVDAFTHELFAGNPAAVMVLQGWPDDEVLRRVAAENNLSETAFVVPEAGGWHLRWFTPTVEVELCGHATLAAGAVLLWQDLTLGRVVFRTASGELVVERVDRGFRLSLPLVPPKPTDPRPAVVEALGATPIELWSVKKLHRADYWLAVFETEQQVAGLAPDLRRLGANNVICTARGTRSDFVSRFFAPGSGVDEDPVTGSAHATLAPYWAERLGKTVLEADQLSRRGGHLTCEVGEDRVWLTGGCVLYLEGRAHLP